MKKHLVKIMAIAIVAALSMSLFSCESADSATDATVPEIGENGNWWIGDQDTGISALGTKGEDGVDGKDGVDGVNGADGKDGVDGVNGADGKDGINGTDGKDGVDGEDGADGKDGVDGADGQTPYIGENGNWWIGDIDTTISAQGPAGATGEKGDKGDKGDQGATGEKGDKGDQGAAGEKGDKGDKGDDGVTPHIGSNGNWWIGDQDTGIAAKGEDATSSDSIISLNKDMETFIIQGKATRSEFFNDKYTPLQFIHSSDMHAYAENWNRMVEFTNYYKDYIDFVIHTGDYVGGDQGAFVDMYAGAPQSEVEIYNCVGNHDTLPKGSTVIGSASKESVYNIIVGDRADRWSVNFLDCEYSMAYYRDFPESNVRFIVLDLYYDIQPQQAWLKGLLDDAKVKGLHVITAMHQPSDELVDIPATNFNTATDYEQLNQTPAQPYEFILADFVQSGGNFIANLVGHTHRDYFGYTWGGVLNIGVECGILGGGWCDNDRVEGTKSQDAFNVIAVDTNIGILKITRIGNNADHMLREKTVLSYDYANKQIITGEGTSYGTKSIEHDNYKAPESTNKYFGYRFIGTRPEGATYNITDSFPTKDESGRAYIRFTGKNTTGQLFWTRMGISGNGQPQAASQLNAFDVGGAQYFVVRMRSNNDIASLNFSIATIVGEVSYDNYDNKHAASINLPQTKLDGEDWTVFVIDLKNTLSGGWFANADGNYTVCQLQFTFNSNDAAKFTDSTYFDISYMAFVDSMSEVKELVDENEIEVVNASNSSITVDIENGTHPGDHLPVEVVDGTTVSVECSLCGYSFGQKSVPESVNRFISAARIFNYSHFQVDTKTLAKDGELSYVSFTSTKSNHIHLWTATGNAGSALDLGANTGKYLVMRVRTDAGTNRIVLTASTSGGKLENMHNISFGDGQWRTVVIDLASTYQYYETNAEAGTPVQIRINGQLNSGTSYTIDIAYAAIVDSVEEAASLIDEETFEYYTQWNGVKAVYDTATAKPKQ